MTKEEVDIKSLFSHQKFSISDINSIVCINYHTRNGKTQKAKIVFQDNYTLWIDPFNYENYGHLIRYIVAVCDHDKVNPEIKEGFWWSR